MENPRVSAPAEDHGPDAIHEGDGAAFARLLARIAGAGSTGGSQALSEQLAQWIDWRQAVVLAEALDSPSAPSRPHTDSTVDADDCARVRAFLVDAIRGDRAFATASPHPTPSAAAGEARAEPQQVDGAFYRQRYLALQQVMEAEIGLLRKRLRERLARRGDADRLATVDAAMERSLAPRERALLLRVPDVLARHFEHLQQQALDDAGDYDRTATAATARVQGFRQQMQRLLLAELDFRIQPSQGLLAALRTTGSARHAE